MTSTASWRNTLKNAVARIDALAARDRLALLAAIVALAGAAEFLVIAPMETQRARIEKASLEQARQWADDQAQAEQQRNARQAELDTRLAHLDRALAALGNGRNATGGRPLSFLLAQALARQDVRMLGLRELSVQDIRPAIPATAADGIAAPPMVAEAPAASAGAAGSPPTALTLYRHRFEVTLGGEPAALIDALHAIDQGARPLRVERVRLSGTQTAAVQLTVTLAVITSERAWLSI